MENRSDDEVVIRNRLPKWTTDVSGVDSGGKELSFKGGKHIGPGNPPDWKLPRHHARRTLVQLKPVIESKAAFVTVTAPAPQGSDVAQWPVTYPKRTWLKARDGFEPKLPTARRS